MSTVRLFDTNGTGVPKPGPRDLPHNTAESNDGLLTRSLWSWYISDEVIEPFVSGVFEQDTSKICMMVELELQRWTPLYKIMSEDWKIGSFLCPLLQEKIIPTKQKTNKVENKQIKQTHYASRCKRWWS